VGSGLPLIHNGQEADNDRRLAFFERDPIIWREGRHDALLRKLIALKTACRAPRRTLWCSHGRGSDQRAR
jgi:hypothetical protein